MTTIDRFYYAIGLNYQVQYLFIQVHNMLHLLRSSVRPRGQFRRKQVSEFLNWCVCGDPFFIHSIVHCRQVSPNVSFQSDFPMYQVVFHL